MPSPIRSVLVLCEGNHCRSPIAELLLRRALGPGIRVASAGLHALEGHPADELAQTVVAEAGLSLAEHRGQQVNAAMLLAADLILVMEEGQAEQVTSFAPAARGRAFLLGHWLPEVRKAVLDPYQLGPTAMAASHRYIQEAVEAWGHRIGPGT